MAGTITIAQLGDRVVFTEGESCKPVVWGGCLTTDGTDWMVPKRVLITWDGTYFDDITSYVCNTDTSTTTVIGGLTTAGALYVCCDVPDVRALRMVMDTANTTTTALTIKGWYSGAWAAADGGGYSWTDNTASGGVSLAQTGNIEYADATDPPASYESEHTLVADIPGFWFQLTWDDTLSATTALDRILFRAPAQTLQVLGDAAPETPMAFIFRDASKLANKDYTVEVSDYTDPTVALLNDGDLESPEAMTSSDIIYIGHPLPFSGVELSPAPHNNNQVAATLSAKYWDGDSWETLTITDGTADTGKTLARKGKITFTVPDDWKEASILSGQWPSAYYIQLQVSTTITAETWISEARVFPVYEDLRKKRHVMRFRNRLVFADDTAARDQVDISRAFDEYGWVGPDSYARRMGGQDVITTITEGYNQGWLFQVDDLMVLNGYNPDTYSFERMEVANQVPLNPRVLIKAPLIGVEQGENRMGFYYLNHEGCWHFTGLQLYEISEKVDWWDGEENPRIDHDYLHKACGVYWPAKNWVIFSVPLVIGAATSQSTNNRLIIYDLNLRAWLPPYAIAAASLCTAAEYQANGVGKLGKRRCYAGDYSGNLVELFPEDTDQDWNTTDISAEALTGWWHFGAPEWIKRIEAIRVWGKAKSGATVTIKIYQDGDESSSTTRTIDEFVGLASTQRFGLGWLFKEKVEASFFRFKIEANKAVTIYGIQVQWLPVRMHKGSRLS